jgi:ABC-type Fe3+-hydroxamate transport system substrate-binding protein
MKKIIFFLTAILLVFTLAACNQTTSQTSQTSNSTSSSTTLSTATQLLVGTLKLEDTAQAVTAGQAKTLLPLWEMLQSLSTSSTAATEEINAVVDLIKGAMTADQMSASRIWRT